MKRRRLALLLLLVLALMGGAGYYYYISFTDDLEVRRNDLAHWLLIPPPLKDLPEIEGRAPVFFHSPGEGTKPITVTVLYIDVRDPAPALPMIRKHLSERGVRVVDPYGRSSDRDAPGARYEAHVDVYTEAAGHEDIRIMVVDLGES